MNKHRLSLYLATALIGGIALVGCKKKDEAAAVPPPAPAPVETAPAPPPVMAPAASVRVTGVTVGKDEAVTTPATAFAPGDKTLYAKVTTEAADAMAPSTGRLTAKWTHLDSNQTVAEESKEFSFTGPGTTTFNINKPDNWPTGKYRLEVSLDGSVVNTTDFEVR